MTELSTEAVEALRENPEFVQLIDRMGELSKESAKEGAVAEAQTLIDQMVVLILQAQSGVAS